MKREGCPRNAWGPHTYTLSSCMSLCRMGASFYVSMSYRWSVSSVLRFRIQRGDLYLGLGTDDGDYKDFCIKKN